MSESSLLEPEPQVSPSPTPVTSPPPKPARFTPQDTAIILCALGMLTGFFAPWTQFREQHASGATLYTFDPMARVTWIIPALALATIVMLRDKDARRRIGTAAGILTWLAIGYAAMRTHFFVAPAWGIRLTIWCTLGLFAFSGDRHISASLDYVAKKLRSRAALVFSHWGTLTPDCHFSTKQFYSDLEQAIRTKEWPGAEILRITYSEAGLLSHKREYLRVIRQRQLFDICAATFGRDYFFSVREAQIPAVVTLRAVLAVLMALFLLFGACIDALGLFRGSFALAFIVVLGVWFLFNVLKLGLTKVDSMLIQLPVVGAIYEAWFRRDTYFQQDTRLAFLQSVNELVKRHVEETTSEKGIKFLDCIESQPILDGLYRRSRIEVKAQAAG